MTCWSCRHSAHSPIGLFCLLLTRPAEFRCEAFTYEPGTDEREHRVARNGFAAPGWDEVALESGAFESKRLAFSKPSLVHTRAAAGHAEALASAQAELNALLNLLLPGAAAEHSAAMNFLAARSQRGWLASELGVLDMATKGNTP